MDQAEESVSLDRARPLQAVLDRPWAYAFADVIARLEAARPQSVPIGQLGPPDREAVRLRPVLDLAFPTADVDSVVSRGDAPSRGPWLVEATFFGLYGESSPLPTYVTEGLFSDEPNPARDFIDILNHRLLSLAYRALGKYRLTRRAELLRDASRLMGIEPEDRAGRRLLPFIGLLTQQPRSAGALGAVLSAAFGGVPVEVEQCVPRWTSLPADRLARLGQENCTLGGDCILGQRIFTRTSTFAILVGPVDTEVFRDFLPGGRAMQALADLVAEFNIEPLAHEVEVAVRGDALEPTTLGGSARLGWDTRLVGDPPPSYHVRITAAA